MLRNTRLNPNTKSKFASQNKTNVSPFNVSACINIYSFPLTAATDMKRTLPFCHLHQVCDRNSPMFHTLTVPAHGKTACGFQSAHHIDQPKSSPFSRAPKMQN